MAASATSFATQLREHSRRVARDLLSFLRLVAKTVATMPSDALAASLVINLLGLALPLAMLQIYDRIVPQKATTTLVFLIMGVCGALALESILAILRGRIVAWAAMRRAWKTNVDAASRVALAPTKLVDELPAGRWMHRLQAGATISEFELGPTPLVLIDLVFVVLLLALLAAAGGWLAAVPVVIFLVFAVSVLKRGQQLRAATAERLMAEARILDFLIDTLNGIVTVKALGAEQQVLRWFERLSEEAASCTQKVVRLANSGQGSGSLVSILTQVATSTVGALLVIDGQISIGVVACSTMLAGRVVQPLLRLVVVWNEIQGVMVAEEVVKPVFDLPQYTHARPARFSVQRLPARLVFEDVSYARTKGHTPLFAAASLDVAPGEIIAITGNDNIGKSTIARLAAGQLLADTGRVLVDSEPVATAVATRSGCIAMVDHRTVAMRGTVLNNLTLFQDADRLEAARAAARLIGLESDLYRLPRGYYTRIGDAATEGLPVGLLQRIAIARAIAGEPRLLILDEANNSVDFAGDQKLAQGLQSLGGRITMVLITNRPSFASIADRLFTLVEGKFCQLDRTSMAAASTVKTAGGVA